MSLPAFPSTGKTKFRLRPSRLEGNYIKFMLSRKGCRMVDIQHSLGLSSGTVSLVTFGFRRSQRVEAEITRILGKDSWNEVVSEAREATREFVDPTDAPSRTRVKRRPA